MSKPCLVGGCLNYIHARGYCSKHYANLMRHKKPVKLFTKKIDFEVDENECFNCTSHALNRDGYPAFRIRGKRWLMSRFVYTEMFGDIPKGLVVRHKCDNAACINPEHLTIGTDADNVNDALVRGRLRRGSSHPKTTLVEGQVSEMKEHFRKRDLTVREIASKYGVKMDVVYQIRSGRRWGHVD